MKDLAEGMPAKNEEAQGPLSKSANEAIRGVAPARWSERAPTAGVYAAQKDNAAEAALKESQAKLHALFEGVETGVFIIDPETHRLEDVNNVAAEMVGLPREKIVGCLCHKFVCPAEEGRCPVTDLGQTVDNSERVLLTANGERRSIIKTVRPVVVEGHTQLVESFLDITDRKVAETALKEQTVYLHSLIEVSPLGIVVLDAEQRVAMSNAAFESLFLYSRDEAQNADVTDLITPDELKSEAAWFAQQCIENGSVQAATRRRRKDGTMVDVRLFAVPLEIDGKPQGFLALYEDITAEKEAGRALRESEDRFRRAFENAPHGMCLTALDGRFMHANAALSKMLGYTTEELQAGAWQQITHPDDLDRSRQAAIELSRASRAVELEKRYFHKNGSVVWARLKTTPVMESSGKTSHYITQIEDITERKKADEAQAFLASLAQSSQDAIIGMSLDGTVMSWNRGAVELYGHTAEEMIGRHISVLAPNDRIEELARILEEVGRGDQVSRCETERVRKDGTSVDVMLTVSPVRDSAGQVIGIVTIGHDITRRKRAQEELLFKTTLLETESETTIDGILVVDGTGRILQANRRFGEIFGIPPHLLGQKDDKLVLEHVRSKVLDSERFIERVEYMYAHESEQARDELELKDGHYIDRYTSPLKDGNGKHYGRIWYFRDITEQRRADQALRESEQRYRDLFENATAIIFITDLEGRFTSLNLAGQKALGYSQEQATQTDIWRLIVPEYQDALKQDRIRMMAGETQFTSEIEVIAKDERRLKLEVRPRLIWHGDKPVGVQVIARDITGRDVAEMELRQAQKLESVGRLASGIAHEINTPIQFVGDNARFLKESFASLKTLLGKLIELRDATASGPVSPDLLNEVRRAEEVSDYAYLLHEIPSAINQTLEGVDRVATIVRAMKEFAHPDEKEMAPADLNKSLMSTTAVARNEWKYVAEIETDFADLPLVVCNIGDLNQVFLNLLVNAAHAIADVVESGSKGRITIRTAAEGDKVHISFADTGSGIPESIRTKIFDPFFTTKEVGRGTGQGLAIARSVVVERHKGTLTFETEVGKGTTFHIRLPVLPE